MLTIRSKADRLRAFAARWDKREGQLDVDPPDGWSPTRRRKFRRGLDGYGGHHPTLLPDRRFDMHIEIPGLTVFRGIVSFGFSRELHLGGLRLSLTGGDATFTLGRATSR